MAIPYSLDLTYECYKESLIPRYDHECNDDWRVDSDFSLEQETTSVASRALNDLAVQIFQQPFVRGVQFIRDSLRLVLKVPFRAFIIKPIFFEKNWQEWERTKVNVKLTGYAFVQLLAVPVKLIVALVAMITLPFSEEKAKWLLDTSRELTACLDGETSRLEALKEEGAKKISEYSEFKQYKRWLYDIDPRKCLDQKD